MSENPNFEAHRQGQARVGEQLGLGLREDQGELYKFWPSTKDDPKVGIPLGEGATPVVGIYRPQGREIVVTTAEDLIEAELGVRVDAIEKDLGPDAARRYVLGMRERGLGNLVPKDIFTAE